MNGPRRPGLVPPELGQEKEEPEFGTEDDIPSEEGGTAADDGNSEERPGRDVERE